MSVLDPFVNDYPLYPPNPNRKTVSVSEVCIKRISDLEQENATLQERLSKYEPIGDGIHDDTAAVQAVIDKPMMDQLKMENAKLRNLVKEAENIIEVYVEREERFSILAEDAKLWLERAREEEK